MPVMNFCFCGTCTSAADDGVATTEAIKKLETKIKDIKGLIIDVRNNPGGLLQTSIDVASLFDRESIILIEEEKNGKRTNYERTLDPIFGDVKLVMLVNEGSASASEIVAGALQDYGKAVIVGEKTFGKGSVQDYTLLDNGSSLKITIAEWLTPQGRGINKNGIVPDQLISAEAAEKPKEEEKPEVKPETPEDIVLQKALEMLK